MTANNTISMATVTMLAKHPLGRAGPAALPVAVVEAVGMFTAGPSLCWCLQPGRSLLD